MSTPRSSPKGTALRDSGRAYRGILETVVPIDEAGPTEDAGEA